MIRAYHNSGTGNLPIIRQVIHATAPPQPRGASRHWASEAGQAESTARYFTSPTSGGSAHHVFDISGGVRCLPDDVIAWHAPPNEHSLGYEICGQAWYTRDDWLSDDVWPAVVHCARQVRADALAHDVPLRRVTFDLTVAPSSGQCGHVDVSETWHQSTHTDPGPDFPWDHFMTLVNEGEEDDMPSVEEIADAVHDRIWKDQWTDPLTGRQQEAWQFLRQAPPLSWMQQRFSDLWQQALANDAEKVAELVTTKAAGGEVTKEIVQDAIRELVNGKEN